MNNALFKSNSRLRLLSALVLFSLAFSFVPPTARGQQTEPERTRQLTPEEKPVKEQKRLALVIGNSKYEHVSPLKNAANDAVDMTSTLKELGFEVISGTDQNEKQMNDLIRDFGDKLMIQKGVGLFFFAGHGVQSRSKNYLIPVDAEILREDEIEFQAIDISAVMAKMVWAKTDLNIIMLDACRNNPFAKEWSKFREVSGQDGLAKIDAPRNTVMFYAAEPGKVAWDGNGKNGTFTEALLEQIKKPDVELDVMTKEVRRSVLEKSKNKQAAYVETTNANDFYFAKTPDKTKPVAPGTVAKSGGINSNITEKDAAASEQEAWDFVKNSTDEDDFRLFLKEFPNGANATQAKIKLEQIVWDSIKTTNDLDAFERFLQEFPNGVNKGTARIKLQRLKAREKVTANKETPPVDVLKDNKTEENKAAENKVAENKVAENKPVENKPAENKAIENKTEENKPSETPAREETKKEIAPKDTGKTRFQREAEAWSAVKDIGNEQEIRAFLQNFPDGANAEKAKIRLERVIWDANRVTKDKASLEAQLKEFPNAENARLARIMLRQLEKPVTETPTEETNSTTNSTRGGTRKINPADKKIAVRSNAAGMEFVYIPAGSFTMGSTQANITETQRLVNKDYADVEISQLANEKPARRVNIAQGFWMGKFEVTQAQWAAVMSDNPSYFKDCDNCPVERVSWEAAKIFVRKLNELDDGFIYRLPSEAEWEYAARAGTTGVFSGSPEAMMWHSGNSEDKTHPVGEKLPNPFGLYDIYGNVSEWCEDIYSPTYEGLPVDGSANTTVGSNKYRVIRGGSWNNFPTKSRSNFRASYPANAFAMVIGFRVVAVQK